ncbi:hypothetical protein, partial [Escherichia coli]|uniref:hypothetical protein n=1 Tax=Escherichia coli TaxID=562 RepID=UPI001C56B933
RCQSTHHHGVDRHDTSVLIDTSNCVDRHKQMCRSTQATVSIDASLQIVRIEPILSWLGSKAIQSISCTNPSTKHTKTSHNNIKQSYPIYSFTQISHGHALTSISE